MIFNLWIGFNTNGPAYYWILIILNFSYYDKWNIFKKSIVNIFTLMKTNSLYRSVSLTQNIITNSSIWVRTGNLIIYSRGNKELKIWQTLDILYKNNIAYPFFFTGYMIFMGTKLFRNYETISLSRRNRPTTDK